MAATYQVSVDWGTPPTPDTAPVTPPSGNPKTALLTENWQGGLNTTRWTDTASATVGGWRLRLAAPGHASTGANKYDFTGSSVFTSTPARASDATGSQGLHLIASLSPEYRLAILVEGGNLLMRRVINGVVSDTTFAYDPWSHYYRRLRHDGSNVYWETSINATTWTVRRGPDPVTADWSAVSVYLQGVWVGTAGAAGRVEFGPVNVAPTSVLSTAFPPASFGSLITLPGSASSRYTTTGMRQMMQEYSWEAMETGDNVFPQSGWDFKTGEFNTLSATGAKVTLALGVQASPSYLAGIANSRVVNETGANSTGNIYDVAWNQLIRDKVERYLNQLHAHVPINNYNIIRLTSGMDPEALLPGGGANWWVYSAGAQSGTNLPVTQRVCPYPGWVPGQTTYGGNTFTVAMAREWYEWVVDSLVDVLNWQIRFYRNLGYNGWFEIVIPGLGTTMANLATEITGLLGSVGATTRIAAVMPWIYQRLVDRHGVVVYCSSAGDRSGSPINNLPDLVNDPAVDLAGTGINNWSAQRVHRAIASRFDMPFSFENPGWGWVGSDSTLQAYYNSTGTSDITTSMAYCMQRLAVTGKAMDVYWAHDNVLNGDVAGATFSAANYKSVVIDPTNGGTNPLTPPPPT